MLNDFNSHILNSCASHKKIQKLMNYRSENREFFLCHEIRIQSEVNLASSSLWLSAPPLAYFFFTYKTILLIKLAIAYDLYKVSTKATCALHIVLLDDCVKCMY
jgi:hypothetical protein